MKFSLLTLLVSSVSAARINLHDFASPCGTTGAPCCNPNVSPPQLCPGGVPCQQCGSDACECPSGPAPAPPGPPPGPASLARLTIVNGCNDSPMWIAHIAAASIGPDPQDVKLNPGESSVFQTSVGGGGLSATRYWPKMGCDESGNFCAIGESGGPGESCVIRTPGKGDNYTKCNPPIDSKFEATFMPPGSPNRDTVDMSLVDGYTLPFKLETSGGDCSRDLQPFESMDCSGLTTDHCPSSEHMGNRDWDLRAVNPRTGLLSGCYSPCKKLTDDKWNETFPEWPGSDLAGPYCCAGAYGSPGPCSAGPIMQSQYLPSVKATCPLAYAYPYDDHIATIVCTTTTEYTVTFYCPAGAGFQAGQPALPPPEKQRPQQKPPSDAN